MYEYFKQNPLSIETFCKPALTFNKKDINR